MRIAMLFIVLGMWTSTGLGQTLTDELVFYEHDGVELVGCAVYDSDLEGPRPGVLVIHEWWGRNDYAQSRAKQLAAMGYVAFVCDMYGPNKVTDDPAQAGAWAKPFYEDRQLMRDRAAAGLAVLRDHRLTNKQSLGVIGFCFGGTTAVELMCSNPAGVVGVVSFHGDPRPPLDSDSDSLVARLLICHGDADPFVPQEKLDAAVVSLEAHGADVTVEHYEGAQHAFTNPAADGYGIEGVGYQEAAATQSWEAMRVFFEDVFRGE